MKHLTEVATQPLHIKKNKNIRIISRGRFSSSDIAMLHVNRMLKGGYHCSIRPLNDGKWVTEIVEILK